MSRQYTRLLSNTQNQSRRTISMAQYKRMTGKSDDELQRIFEKEMRLGVLSTQNLLYPFPGTFMIIFSKIFKNSRFLGICS